MPRTARDLDIAMLGMPGVSVGVVRSFWPYGHDWSQRPTFDLEAEVLEGWVRAEGDEIIFDTGASNSRVTVEGDEIVVRR